jgi:MATE family multidrug resistance protein
MGIALSAIILIVKNHVGAIYSSDAGVVVMTGAVLAWVAVYHAFDAFQTLSVFVLRCYGITVAPLAVYCLLLWGAGLGGGYVLAYGSWGPWANQAHTAAATPTPFWAASAAALGVTAVLFVLMLRRALVSQKARLTR